MPVLERIIVPLDGSARSERTLDLAVPLAERLGSELTLIHVLLPRHGIPSRPGEINYPDALHDRTRAVATDYLSEVSRHFVQGRIRTRTVVAAGDVSSMVLAHSNRSEYGLIAVRPRPRGHVMRLFREGATEAVWMRTSTPMLLMPPDSEGVNTGLPERVVIPVDGSTRSEDSLEFGGRVARGTGATVTILGARPVRSLSLAGDANAILYADEPFEYLGERASRLREGGLEVTVIRRDAGILEALTDAAAELPDHIVVTSAGRAPGFMQRVVGSREIRLARRRRNPIIFLPPGYSASDRSSA